MLEYIIDLKQTSQYKAASFWTDLKGQNTCKVDGKDWIFKY